MNWMAVKLIPPMMMKSGIVTAQGIVFYRGQIYICLKLFRVPDYRVFLTHKR